MKFDLLRMTDEEKVKILTDFGMKVKKGVGKVWDVSLPTESPLFFEFLAVGEDALNRGLIFIDHQDPVSTDVLIARGAEQKSRKYRMVACLPEGMTAIQALKERAPAEYKRLEEYAGSLYRTYVAERFGDMYELSIEQFNEFLEKTGRKPNKFLETPREACPDCRTLGHIHRNGCPSQKSSGTVTDETKSNIDTSRS